jgi:uncharacterized damage-inducible protein DinB
MTPSGSLDEILTLNPDLFDNALDGMSDRQAQERVHGTNPVAFRAAHLVDARCLLAAKLGTPVANPIGVALQDARSADDVQHLPPLDVLRGEWARVSAQVERALAAVSEDRLRAPTDHRFPVRERTVGAGVAFLLQHESFHIGQTALLRRQLGCPALTYRRRHEDPT